MMRPSCAPPFPSAISAGKAWDEDAEDRDDAVDDDLDTGCNGVHDTHDACTDGAEEVRYLQWIS